MQVDDDLPTEHFGQSEKQILAFCRHRRREMDVNNIRKRQQEDISDQIDEQHIKFSPIGSVPVCCNPDAIIFFPDIL